MVKKLGFGIALLSSILFADSGHKNNFFVGIDFGLAQHRYFYGQTNINIGVIGGYHFYFYNENGLLQGVRGYGLIDYANIDYTIVNPLTYKEDTNRGGVLFRVGADYTIEYNLGNYSVGGIAGLSFDYAIYGKSNDPFIAS